MLDDHLEIYKGICDIKKVYIFPLFFCFFLFFFKFSLLILKKEKKMIFQVKLSGKILPGNSIRKSIVNEAKNSGAVAVIVGISKPGSIG